jgi:hypothetical protein
VISSSSVLDVIGAASCSTGSLAVRSMDSEMPPDRAASTHCPSSDFIGEIKIRLDRPPSNYSKIGPRIVEK